MSAGPNEPDSGSLPDVLTSFASNPRQFVVGAVLATLLEGLFGIVTAVLDGVLTILAGTKPAQFAAPGEKYGLADLPVLIARSGIEGLNIGFGSLVVLVESVNQPIFDATASLGIVGGPILAAVLVAEIAAVLFALEFGIKVLLDVVPGGGAIADYIGR